MSSTKFSVGQIEIIQEAVDTWDMNKTVKRASEELIELSLSLLHFDRKKVSSNEVLEEMADVRIVLAHLEIKFGSYQKQLDKKVLKANS